MFYKRVTFPGVSVRWTPSEAGGRAGRSQSGEGQPLSEDARRTRPAPGGGPAERHDVRDAVRAR